MDITVPSWITLLLLVLALFIGSRLAWALVRAGQRGLAWFGRRAGRVRPWGQRLASRLPPRWRQGLAARLNTQCFTGLPLTLMTLAAIYVAALVAGLVEELWEARELVLLDRYVDEFLLPLRAAALLPVFGWISDMGDSNSLVVVCLVATGFLWAYGRPYAVMPLWLTVGGAQLTTWAGKFALDRPRPEFVLGFTAWSPAFPSAHAAGAMAVYGFVAYLLVRQPLPRRARFELTYWTAVLIALVGLSRVVLVVHYASDVLAGWLVGVFWLLVGFAALEYRRQGIAQP